MVEKNPSEYEKLLDLFPDSEYKRDQIAKLCLNPNSKYYIKENDKKEELKEKIQDEENNSQNKNSKIEIGDKVKIINLKSNYNLVGDIKVSDIGTVMYIGSNECLINFLGERYWFGLKENVELVEKSKKEKSQQEKSKTNEKKGKIRKITIIEDEEE